VAVFTIVVKEQDLSRCRKPPKVYRKHIYYNGIGSKLEKGERFAALEICRALLVMI